MTVREMLSRISSEELTEWQAFNRLEPFGAGRGDLQAGIVAATIANVHRKKNSKAYSPKDFLLRFGPRERMPWQQMLAMVEQMNKAMGGKDMRPGREIPPEKKA